tara:strand:- start:185 stop:370 length:186 start_codon:yes stop_codon:yes gene_type:complete
VTASEADGIWCDIGTKREVDLDELYQIEQISQIILDPEEEQFYMLNNKRRGKLGFYLIKFS